MALHAHHQLVAGLIPLLTGPPNKRLISARSSLTSSLTAAARLISTARSNINRSAVTPLVIVIRSAEAVTAAFGAEEPVLWLFGCEGAWMKGRRSIVLARIARVFTYNTNASSATLTIAAVVMSLSSPSSFCSLDFS
ncbi:hypothetical protein KC336_g86 [Hortaea werneckii]|nr:hypothetical protein KC336_g86 [Hortaea werneckii]